MDIMSQPLVSVVCTTYNHEAYIRECLDGFVMQQTNFPIEIIVHDDASTDSTAAIVKEYEEKYPNLFNNIYRTENWYSRGKDIWGYLFTQKARGKYIAICEGDDYWTDPLKLQKQVDFMEGHPEYGMCYTKVRRFYQKSGKLRKIWGGKNETFSELLSENTIPTLSVLFVREILFHYQEEIKPEEKNWNMGDYPLWLWIAKKSKVHFMNEITGVYRILVNSASHSSDYLKALSFQINGGEIASFFAHKYSTMEAKVDIALLWTKLEYAVRSHNKEEIANIKKRVKSISANYSSLKTRVLYYVLLFPPIFIPFLDIYRLLKRSLDLFHVCR